MFQTFVIIGLLKNIHEHEIYIFLKIVYIKLRNFCDKVGYIAIKIIWDPSLKSLLTYDIYSSCYLTSAPSRQPDITMAMILNCQIISLIVVQQPCTRISRTAITLDIGMMASAANHKTEQNHYHNIVWRGYCSVAYVWSVFRRSSLLISSQDSGALWLPWTSIVATEITISSMHLLCRWSIKYN